MKYHLVNLPKHFERSEYDRVIGKVVDYLSDQREVISIYQAGSVSDHGISDIDLLVVFAEGYHVKLNPLRILSPEERYPFTHSLFGVSEQFTGIDYSDNFHFNAMKRLYGKKFEIFDSFPMRIGNPEIDRQVALEFLFMNYLSRNIEKTYRVLSVRNLLLSLKGMLFDLDLLGIKSGNFHNKLLEIVEIRKDWVERKSFQVNISEWYEGFFGEFADFIKSLFRNHELYVHELRGYRFSRNVQIGPGRELGFSQKGFILPSVISSYHCKARKLNNRLNRFEFTVPMNTWDSDSLSKRVSQSREIVADLKRNSVFFGPPISSFLYHTVK